VSNSRLVYSTDNNIKNFSEESDLNNTISTDKQKIRLHLDRKKGGKMTTVIRGIVGTKNELKGLARDIKINCASGGSLKNNEIIIQGNKREIIKKFLVEKGYDVKFSGG
tara:strand:+ start:126 stop:452 length:327 start_codon:yes stop_codon:yes gene_type:complete